MLLIFGNCISLALFDPMQSADSYHNATLGQFGRLWSWGTELGLNICLAVDIHAAMHASSHTLTSKRAAGFPRYAA